MRENSIYEKLRKLLLHYWNPQKYPMFEQNENIFFIRYVMASINGEHFMQKIRTFVFFVRYLMTCKNVEPL